MHKNVEKFCSQLEEITKEIVVKSNAAHLGSSLSLVNLISNFFVNFYKKKNIYPIIVSKGHAAAVYYSALYLYGDISKKEINTYCLNNTLYPGHITKNIKYVGLPFSSGSLGHGLPFITGLAYGSKKLKKNDKYFVIISDGELNEGTSWESLLICNRHKLSNLKIIIDYNKFQSYGTTKEVLGLNKLKLKLSSFDLDIDEINGHSNTQINSAFRKNTQNTHVIIANTIKGIGMGKLENQLESHYINN